MDNLPAAVQVHVPDTDATYKLYERGFPVGNVEKGEADETPRNYYIHNHFNLKIMTHSSEEFSGFRIVGFEVEPLRWVLPPDRGALRARWSHAHPVTAWTTSTP